MQKLLTDGFAALSAGDINRAGSCARHIIGQAPHIAAGHFLVALIAQRTDNLTVAREALETVLGIDKTHVAAWTQLSHLFVRTAQYANAEIALEKALAQNPSDPLLFDMIGHVYGQLGDQKSALIWYNKAVAARPDGATFQMNRATCLIFHGETKAARTALEAVLKLSPSNTQAHWMLARLDTAKGEEHIDEMLMLDGVAQKNPTAAAFLWYGIAKEYEDLENWDAAAKAYEKGAKAKRSVIKFNEKAEDVQFKALKETFTKQWLSSASAGHEDAAPIFIIGQPRTGTTLVERIITSHSDVHSAGELQQFGKAVRFKSGAKNRDLFDADAIQRAADISLKDLGETYMFTCRKLRGETPHFVDKMPLNYMFTPLIAAALPKAKIIHLVRSPMDSCFSSYKQLFAEAYYHSYDMQEMARHYIRYRKLMDHWRDLLGDRILDIEYETVVQDVEGEARRITGFLGLDWQASMVDFHEKRDAVTTASASQVREKAHTRSINRWQKFENHLKPMQEILANSGYTF